MRINLISLGCPKNLVDSEKILGSLGGSGIEITHSPKHADIVIINTCGFIKSALEETEQEIEKALALVSGKHKKVLVYGCAVNRMGPDVRQKYARVAAWFKLEEKEKLITMLNRRALNIQARFISTKGYAYLKIADGCSNHCSYCTIPSIKGEYQSVAFDDLIREAHELAKLSIRELILIGQDTTRYGLDRYHKQMLVPLIKELSRIKHIRWIRLMYAHPKSLSDEIINEIVQNHKVCKYIDLPIQHINDRILRLMNRGVNREHIERTIAQLRQIKEISIRTTVLVGFPTETNNEFKELFQFLEQNNPNWLGVFPYSREANTKASSLKQVAGAVIKNRYGVMLDLQKKLIRQNNKERLGRFYEILIHHKNGDFIGHAQFSAPDIDSQIRAQHGPLNIGNLYRMKITRTRAADLYAEIA